jgi:hypothetical protein
MWGGSASKKRDFFRIIEGVRKQALTSRTIRSSFKSRGIYPLDPEVILSPLRQRDLDTEGEIIRIFTPSPPGEISSSVTNSPPDTIKRVNKLNTKLIKDIEQIEHYSQRMKRHIQRSMDANTLLVRELSLLRASLKKSQEHKSAANTARNGKSILGSRRSVLGPASANRMIKKRQDADSKKPERQQAKHAKALEVEEQAQKPRDLAEAEHEAAMAARDSRGANWYIDSHGGYL